MPLLKNKIVGGGWVFQKSYVIFRVGHDKCLRLLTRWAGGVKKGQKHAYVILEWSLTKYEGFQQPFSFTLKFVCSGFYMKKNLTFTLISFVVLK